jgi:uncharacterized protein (TIGR02246 family)
MRLASIIAAFSVTLVALPLAAQQPPAAASAQLPSITLKPELDRVLRDYETAWAKGDAPALAALFSEDGFVMQNGKPPVRGRAAIQAAYTGSSGGQLKLRALAVSTADTIGFIVGAYGYNDSSDMGKFTLTLKRPRGGKWLIFSDMDNGSSPPRRPGV